MKQGEDCLVVSASNEEYCDLLLTMLRSLGSTSFDVGIFDLGLTARNKSQVSRACKGNCVFIDPGWCLDLPYNSNRPDYKKVFLAKPFIPEIFPGYPMYLWIDADIWFQDSSATNDYIEAAIIHDMAVCYEDHPLYEDARKKKRSVLQVLIGRQKKSYKAKRVRQYFGRAAAQRLGVAPTLNSGIFALKGSSEIWRYWQNAMRIADLQKLEKKRLICDQTCLDVAISMHGITPAKLPPTHNWCLGLAQPKVCKETGLLLDTLPPHQVIKVLHLTGSDKVIRNHFADYFLDRLPRQIDESEEYDVSSGS